VGRLPTHWSRKIITDRRVAVNELVLRLFFHGLIAFVPTDSTGMNAYLVKQGHLPLLAYEMTRTSMCPDGPFQEVHCGKVDASNSPGNAGDWCLCEIGGGIKISFQPQTMGSTRPIDDKPDRLKPETATQSADFSWLVRMANVQDGSLVHIKEFGQIKHLVSASMSFKWLSERSCHLDQISTCECEANPGEGCEFKVHPFRFIGPCGLAVHRQALSEYASFELRLPFRPVALILEQEGEEGSEPKQMSIDLGCGPRECPDVLIANLVESPPCTEKDPPDLGSHFLAYYGLAREEETLKKLFPNRQVENNSLPVRENQLFTCLNDPLRKLKKLAVVRREMRRLASPLAVSSEVAFLDKFFDLLITAAQSRIICPMAMFDP
jgi:hypothetical protein